LTTGIRWLSVGPGSGYGDASEAYLSGLRAAGTVPVSWMPMGWESNRWGRPFGPRADPDLEVVVHKDIANLPIEHDTVVVASPPIWNEQLALETFGKRLVAYTTWETDRLAPELVETLERYEPVLVPSQWNRDTFVSSGLTTPVRVVPHIAAAVPSPCAPVDPASAHPFVFYVIATWSTRKAILDALDAFVATFGADDDVVLVIHTTPEDHIARARLARGVQPWSPHGDKSWFTLANALAGRPDPPGIVLSTRWLDRSGIDALHARGDCFVSLSRGEGWGLGSFDAGAHGNPVLVTGWCGTLDFLPSGYPYLVDYDLAPTVSDESDDWWSPRPGERWAKARVAHAAVLLRHIFEHRAQAREWGRVLQSKIHANFDSAQVTRRLLDALAPT
jgi:glycosyltransferase involved in cell wall biosynthesis